jgi:hypothetical protein
LRDPGRSAAHHFIEVAVSTRDLFVKNAKSQLDEWTEELDRLEGPMLPDDGWTESELEKHTAELKRLRAAVLAELRDIEQSGDGTWEHRKIGAEQALTAMQEALASACAQFR